MSTLKTNNVQVGQSVTATNNFTIYQPATPDGTVRIGVGNSGATTADVITANSSGNVGIGTSSPSDKLAVISAGTQVGSTNFRNIARVGLATNDASVLLGYDISAGSGIVASTNNFPLAFWTSNAGTYAERARIDSSGNLLVGTTTSQGRFTVQTATTTAGTRMAAFADANGRFSGFYEGADGTTFNAANTVLGVRSTTGTGRSINAAGTVNASGADYAEYMTKAGDFVVAKGDVVGINQQGLLTNVFVEAVSFVVKSTSPSYVGGDTWGGGLEDDLEALEAARQKVDRIAFAGQVPVNVLNAMPGQYIVPVEDNGGIKGVAKNEVDLTLAEYIRAVGKVIAIETDGRAKIIVKVA